MTRFTVATVATLALSLLSACNGGGDPASEGRRIGPAGGTVSLDGGPSLEIPAGALAQTVAITITQAEMRGPIGAITPVFKFEPEGLSFAVPITVHFPVPTGTTAASVYWTRTGTASEFESLPTTVSGGTASAQVTHFSSGYTGREGGPFSNTDLEGEWRYTILLSSGWIRGRCQFDAAATLTDLGGETGTGPFAGGAVRPWTLDPNGTVRSFDPFYPDLNGQMNGAKDLIAATATHNASGGGQSSLRIYQKVLPGTTFALPDLAGKTFTLHSVQSGATRTWSHGSITIASDGTVSFGEWSTSTGTIPPVPNAGTMAVSADGTVTSTAFPTFSGVLSADKSFVVGVDTPQVGAARLLIFTLPPASPSVADLEGVWGWHSFWPFNGGAAWSHGDVTYTAGVTASFGNVAVWDGSNTPPNAYTAEVSTDGTITAPEQPTRHGALAQRKDLLVFTADTTGGNPFMTLTVR